MAQFGLTFAQSPEYDLDYCRINKWLELWININFHNNHVKLSDTELCRP